MNFLSIQFIVARNFGDRGGDISAQGAWGRHTPFHEFRRDGHSPAWRLIAARPRFARPNARPPIAMPLLRVYSGAGLTIEDAPR
jgi:hypothetical protein